MWKDRLGKDHLLVPMKLEALVVGKETEDCGYTDAAANFRMLEYTSLAKQMQTSPFTYTDPLQKGVHLHWILPEAFTHGKQMDEDQEVVYPEVPDKWLVVRIVAKPDGIGDTEVETRAFLVESKYISGVKRGENQYSQPYPVMDSKGRMSYVYLGRSVDAQYDSGPGNYLDSLTSFGYGDPSFYAFYQNCRNVFGFYDDLEDVSQGELSYLVCGWFGDAQADPLRGKEDAFQELLRELGWRVLKSENQDDYCKDILCHGFIQGISWKGADYPYPSGVPAGNPQMAVGNNSTEAVSALLMQKTNRGNVEERLFYSFLNGNAADLGETDGIIKAEQTIHENMFDVWEGERCWILKEREHDKKEGKAPEPSWETACCLDRLNKEQRKLECLLEDERRREKEIYFLWYEYTANACTLSMSLEIRERYLRELKEQMLAYKMLGLHKATQQQLLKECRSAVESMEEVRQHYHLLTCPGERFYVPSEPVLLFAGEGISNLFSKKEKEEEKSGEERLLCRTYSQIMSGFRLKENKGAVSTERLCENVSNWYFYPDIIRRLLGECILADTALVSILVRQLLAEELASAPEEMLNTKQSILKFQESIFGKRDSENVFVEGFLPAPAACSLCREGYQPLFMEWGIFYHPDEECLGKGERLRKWRLDKIDYELTEDISFGKRSGKYKGRMLLTSHAAENICTVLDGYREHAGEQIAKQLEEMKEQLRSTEILSQRLNGFQEYFLREKQVMHLPLASLWEQEPEVRALASEVFSKEEKAQFYTHMDRTILTDPYMEGVYSPVRAGFMEVVEIRLVDTFGRAKSVCSEDNYELESKAMAFSENFRREGEEEKIILPPRIMFPARLSCYFESMRDKEVETSDLKCTTPIFGWLVPGYIDGSLTVLDAGGIPLGKYQTFHDRKGHSTILFVNSANEGKPKLNGRFEIPGEIHVSLRRFMEGFYECMTEGVKTDSQILSDFVNYLCFDISNMKQHRNIPGGSPWIMGQPLALANLTLVLETRENPGRKPDWDRQNQDPSPLEKISFPLYIGDKRRRDDGLTGFFSENETGFYKQIFMERRESYDTGTFVCGENRLELSWNKKKTVTLLFDPLLPIHLISGILPVKKISLPRELAQDALVQIKPQLFVHPVLKGAGNLQIPVPQEQGKEWEFIGLENGIYRTREKVKKEGLNTMRPDYPLSLTEGWLQQREESKL